MFTLSLLYVYLYILCLIIIFYLFTSLLSMNFLINYSFGIFITFLRKYTIFQSIFLGIFICLSGLPPVGLFLVKFNMLNYVFHTIILLLF